MMDDGFRFLPIDYSFPSQAPGAGSGFGFRVTWFVFVIDFRACDGSANCTRRPTFYTIHIPPFNIQNYETGGFISACIANTFDR